MACIVNIRGTSGAGKTTLIRTYVRTPPIKLCEAEFEGKRRACWGHYDPATRTAVVGKYGDELCGGCDNVKPGELIRTGVEAAVALGAELVLFEGVIVSTIFSTYAAFDHQMRRAGHTFVWAFLQPPEEDCVARALSRFGDGYDDAKRAKVRQGVLDKWRAVKSSRYKVKAAELCGVDLDTTLAADGTPAARAQLDAYVAGLAE